MLKRYFNSSISGGILKPAIILYLFGENLFTNPFVVLTTAKDMLVSKILLFTNTTVKKKTKKTSIKATNIWSNFKWL